MNNTNSTLEPRLTEYIKRKKFYELNNITNTAISLERQYMITKDDLHLIKEYNRNQQNDQEYINLPTENYEKDTDLISFKQTKFPSTQIVDPRLNRINQKIKKERDANKFRSNTSNLQRSYDMYSRDFSSTTSKDFENEFNLDNIRDDLSKVDNGDTNVYESNSSFNTHELVNQNKFDKNVNYISPRLPSQHQYHVTPSIVYKQKLHYQRDDSQQNLLGSGFTYRKANIPNFEKQHQFDLDTRNSIPAMSMKSRKSEAENLYTGVAELTGGPLKNIDYENYIKYGYPTSKSKSLGYENPFENQFQYIDDDIQNPDHVVFDRPTSTRLENRVIARPKKRDIY